MATTYHFDWDASKARANLTKHGVSFRLATSVFRDPLALTVYDGKHRAAEERWVTIGQAENGQLLVIVHTYRDKGEKEALIQIISTRKADKQERHDYEQTPQ